MDRKGLSYSSSSSSSPVSIPQVRDAGRDGDRLAFPLLIFIELPSNFLLKFVQEAFA
jgi:hypothetical protein